jgi:hypothetical protein
VNDRPAPSFAGLRPPSVPFTEVRDRTRAFPLYFDVDLTAARSIAAGTHLTLPLAGNFFYIDQDPANVGFATVRFVDNQSVIDTPIFVGPGANWKVPFTGLVIENTAQAGKRLRIIYSVDQDAVPGINAQVVINGAVGVQGPHAINSGPVLADLPVLTREVGALYGASNNTNVNLAAGATATMVTAASNVNGVLVHRAFISTKAAADQECAMLAKATAPTSVIDGDCIVAATALANTVGYDRLQEALFIPAGKGIFLFSNVLETLSYKSLLYTIL